MQTSCQSQINMNDYDFQQELEALAGNAYNPGLEDGGTTGEPMSRTIERWQLLFDLSSGEAVDRIMEHRNHLTRLRISDAHWETIRVEKEAGGYDREAYDYEVNLQKKKAGLHDLIPTTRNSGITYLVEMTGRLDCPEMVQQVSKMLELPEVVTGRSLEDGRAVRLCSIDASAKKELLTWTSGEGGGFEPTILVNPKSLR